MCVCVCVRACVNVVCGGSCLHVKVVIFYLEAVTEGHLREHSYNIIANQVAARLSCNLWLLVDLMVMLLGSSAVAA